MVKLPANAQGEADALVKPHPLYTALALDAPGRQAAYRDRFRYELEPGRADEIRQATTGIFALGNELFATQVSAALGRRAAPGKCGRPRRGRRQHRGSCFRNDRIPWLSPIRPQDGEIYRIIGPTGANKYTNAIEELIDLGLEDELEGQPKDGFQAIFRAV